MIDPGTIARVLFWGGTASMLLVSHSRALLIYLALVHIDLSGPGFGAGTSIGFENAIKVIVLPTLLAWPVRHQVGNVLRSPLVRIFIAFLGYAAVAAIWSDRPLAALKMVGYLYSYLVLFVVLYLAWRDGELHAETAYGCVATALALGIVQTFLCGNVFGANEESYAPRFTSFTSAQAYAAWFASLLPLLLISKEMRAKKVIAIGASLLAIVATGSRYVMLGTITMLIIWLLGKPALGRAAEVKQVLLRSSKRAIGRLAVALLAIYLGVTAMMHFAPENRIAELVASPERTDLQEVATLAWRLSLYSEALTRLSERSYMADVFGSGTSSGGDVLEAIGDPRFAGDELDANRAVHNEFLRAYYEWGLVGSILFASLLLGILVHAARRFLRQGSDTCLACLSLFPTLVLGLMLENILANPGAPAGTGFVLVIALAASTPQLLSRDLPEATLLAATAENAS